MRSSSASLQRNPATGPQDNELEKAVELFANVLQTRIERYGGPSLARCQTPLLIAQRVTNACVKRSDDFRKDRGHAERAAISSASELAPDNAELKSLA